MALTGKIRSLFLDKEKTQAIFPLTKTKAVSDDNGVGLDAILDNVNENIKKAAPHNLLDNSDFTNPVNQRGQTSYTAAGYTIDRWVNSTKNGTINVLSDCISKLGMGALYQHIEGLDPTKTYTGAVCLDDGTINVQSGILANSIGSSGKGVTINHNADTGIATFYIGIDKPSGTNYKWAALYEGEYTVDTLPKYIPKGYGAELAECQRYFIRLISPPSTAQPVIAGIGTASSAYTVFSTCSLPTTMRMLPTVSAGRLELLSKTLNSYFSVSEAAVYPTFATNSITIQATTNGAVAGDVYYPDRKSVV